MNVVGLTRKNNLFFTFPSAVKARREFSKCTFRESASASKILKPMLWRVLSYSLPGFPKPTINILFIGVKVRIKKIPRFWRRIYYLNEEFYFFFSAGFFSSFFASFAGAAAVPAAGVAPAAAAGAPATAAAAAAAGVTSSTTSRVTFTATTVTLGS